MYYEISIVLRDSLNQPIYDKDGNLRRKLFVANTASELHDIWVRNGPQVIKKRKKKKNVQDRKDAPKE